ncbi:eag [Symbiodinium sp. CCMP2592]|nr:eag [Symbiodinium sp. CCMP2592]
MVSSFEQFVIWINHSSVGQSRKRYGFLRVQLKLPEQFELEIDQPEFSEEAADEVLPEFSKENSELRVSVNVKRISTVSLPRLSLISGASFEADPASAIQGPPCLLARLSQSSGRQSTGKGTQPLDAPRTSGITEKLVLKSRWSKEIKTISTMGTQLLEEMHQTAHRESADGRYRRQNQARRTIFDRARPRWLPLHPGSSVRLTWDALALVLLFYDVVYIPLGALDPPSTTFTDVLEWFSLVFWTLDMVMTCLSAYYYKGEIVTEFRRIAKNYLKTWFFLDVVVLAPEWMERLGSAGEESGEAFKIIRSFRFLRTLRLLRLLKLQKLLAMVYDLIDSEFTFIMFTCIRLIFFIVVLNHCIACVWYWVGKSSLEGGYDSWMNIGGVPIIEASFPYRYTTSMHWSLTQFTPASMEISARNTGERVFSIMILFFALIVFSSVIGQVTSSMMSLQNMQALRDEFTGQQQKAVLAPPALPERSQGEVPKKSRSRIIRFLEQRVPKESQKVQQRDIKILSLLSEPLKDLLAWELHRRLLGRHRLFYILHGAIEAMMMRVCSVAVSESTLAEQDELFRAGESASHMTFVLSGHFHYQPGARDVSQRFTAVKTGEPKTYPDAHVSVLGNQPALQCNVVSVIRLCHLDPGKFADVMQAGRIFGADLSICAHHGPWNFCKQYALGFLDALNNLEPRLWKVRVITRQWLVFHQFDVALIQEHHLSERAFHAETVALAKAGYHVHGQHSPVRKREIGGVMVCVKSHLQARHVHTFQDPETGCGFVAVAIRVTGFDLALLSLYLESGSTFEGRANTLVLSNMYAVIASLKCPWCVVGDWNLDLQPNLRSITDSFDPILDDQRNLQPPVVSPQRVTLLEIEACDPASLAFAEFSATAEASGLLGRTMGRGVNLPTIRQPAVSQPPNDYQWFGHEHSVWSQLAGRFKAGGPPNETLSLLSKLGPEHHQWADEARDTVSNHRDLAALRSHAEAQAKLAKTAQQGAQAESYQQWLLGALSAGMGPVYRALKSHEQTLARPFRDQSALARAYCRMEFWSRIWDASIVPPQPHLSAERLALRAEALQQAQDLSPLSWEQVKTACLATGNKKGGLDGWSYKALRNLPDFCYRQLAGLFRLAETDLTLPLQMLTVQVALLAKTPEKERPISLTSVLWRVYSKLRRPLLESWLKEYAAFAPFDSATPGHTSLDPALSRLIKAEDHKFRKVTFITLFVDLEGFYDGVDFSRLISQGKALSFPPLLLELSLQLYNGPRCLHGEGVSTVALWPQRGILQGCPYAPTVAKLTTHAPLQGISQHRGVSHADLWLDDISVDVSHADPEVAASLALSASRKLEALLSVEKLRINKTKTKFVVNSAKAAKALNSMRVEGDPQVADLVRDLGLDSAGAKRRRVTHALKRFKVGRARNQKLHQLGTGCKAHRLYATSILTAEIYGCQGQGLSPKRLKVVRASISRHVGRSKWGSVDVSLDCMSFRCQDPLLTVVLAQADALYKMFGPSTAQGWEILARTWKVAWTRQEAAVHGWKCVAGPVAAMVQYCIDLRINVSDPLRWVHSSGVLLLDVTNPGLFLSVRRFLTQVVALERASRFGAVPTAQGAQQGVDWSVHRKLLKVSKPSSPRWAFHAVWQGRTLHAGNGPKGLDDPAGLGLSFGNQGDRATTGSFDLTGDCKPALKALAFEAEFPGQLWRRELNAKADTLAGLVESPPDLLPVLFNLPAPSVNPPAGPVASSAAAAPRLPECQGEVTQSTGMPAAVPPVKPKAQGLLSMAPKQEGRHISTQLRREERGLSWKSAATIDRQRGRKKARKQKKRREQYEHAGRRTEEAWPPPPPPPGPRAEARHREDEELPYDLEEPSPSGLRAPSTAAASSSQGPAREEPSPLGLRAPPPTAAASSSQGLPLQRLSEAEEPPVDQDDSSNCLQSDSSETPQPAVALKDRPSDFGPLLHEDGLITFLCAAAPQVKHPVNHYQCLPESLEVYHDFVTGGRTKAARARRLGFGKSRTVYVDPGSSEHVLKLAPPQGHGPEPEAWRRLPHIVPCTLDAGIHLLTLSWKSCYDIISTHVLRQSRLTPLSVWRPAPPDLDMVRYMMALTAEASRFYNLKDLGFFNFGVDARGFIMMWDTADWLPWEGQRAHWPNRQRASAFWSAVKRSVPDHFQELLQLVSNASPEEVLQRLRPLLTQHYKWCLLQQGVFLGD